MPVEPLCHGLTVPQRLEMGVPELGVSPRIANKLEEELGVIYVHQLLNLTEYDLRGIHGFGGTMIEEVFDRLADWGFSR